MTLLDKLFSLYCRDLAIAYAAGFGSATILALIVFWLK
jgi:hypothetical protein